MSFYIVLSTFDVLLLASVRSSDIEVHEQFVSALTLLTLSSMQKMVMSLSCDRAVWDAVMNNEAVQEFRRSFQDGMLH
jgi:hypothetical protein